MSGVPSGDIQRTSVPFLNGLQDDFRGFSNLAGDAANSFPPLRGAYQLYCQVWAGSGVPSSLSQSDPVSFCAPYLAEVGQEFGEQGEPVSGGQCPGTEYRVTFSYRWLFEGESESGIVNVENEILVGPVTPYSGPSPSDPNRTVWGFRGFTVQGAEKFAVVLNPNDLDPGRIGSLKILDGPTITVEDGPDDCGDTPQPFLPGPGFRGRGYGDPYDYTDQNGNNNSISVGAPVVNPDGSISLPVTVNGDEFDLGVPGAQAPEGAGDFGPSFAGDPVSPSAGGGLTPLPENPPGTVCIGIAIVLGSFLSDVGFVEGTEPNRRLFGVAGNVSLSLEANDGSVFYGEDVVLRSERTFVPIPVEGLNCVGYRLHLSSGQALSVTPVYRQDEEAIPNDE